MKNNINVDKIQYIDLVKKLESFNKMVKRIGGKVTKQKGGFDKILHIVDLEQISSEVKENITKKLSQALEAQKILLQHLIVIEI